MFCIFLQKLFLKKLSIHFLEKLHDERGIVYNFISSYFRYRRLYVHMNDTFSECQSITYGVPQGWVL